jgi:alcohol dehydrogenase class IV
MLKNFDFFIPVRIRFGVGISTEVGKECAAFSQDKVMVVTDKNLIDTNIYKKIIESLAEEKLNPIIFTDFPENPDEESIDRGLAELRRRDCRVLVGFGGGSAMDVARALAISATIDGPIQQYEGINTLTKPILPLVSIPTTAGTGSEVSATTVITNNRDKRKYIVKSPYAFSKVAVLDPEGLMTLPEAVAASAGMDAIVHAVESYISRASSTMSEMFATTSLKLASTNIRAFVRDRSNLEAGGNMLLASMFAAISMAQAGLGVLHALANTIGGQFHSPHGLTCALLLCECLEDMTGDAVEKFAEMAKIIIQGATYGDIAESARGLPDLFRKLLSDLGLDAGIGQLGVREKDLPRIVEHTSTVVAGFSPKHFNAEDMIQLLRRAL